MMEKIIIYDDPMLREIGEEYWKKVEKYYKQYIKHKKKQKSVDNGEMEKRVDRKHNYVA